ncbi:MAG: MFS transporter [Chloroflexota bacterium]
MKTTENVLLKSKVIARTPFFYGWVILAAGILGNIMSSPGQTYSFSIFIEEFIRDLELSRTAVSSLYTIGTITGSLALPYIGRAIDKRGNRPMVIIIATAFGIACLYMSTVSSMFMLLIGIVFMRMLGQSSMTIVSRNVINQWWVRRRGFVLGIASLAASFLGTGLFPNLINWLIPQFGWRMTYVILGAMVISIMVPIGYLFFREQPERYGLLPDGATENTQTKTVVTEGATTATGSTASTGSTSVQPIEENWTAGEAMRTSAFWFIILSIAAFSMLVTGLTFHIVSIFIDNGLTADLAAAVFLPMSITASLVAIPGGWLIDRIDAKYMLSVGLITLTITILFSANISSPQLGILYGVIFGLGNGIQNVVGSVIWANYFGRKNLGAISGITMTFGAASSGLGPLVYGLGRDLAGEYWPSLWISALYPATMAILVLFMKRPTRNN